MTQEQELFISALELAAEAREEFLQTACRGDESMLIRIRTLLAAHDQRADRLEIPLYVKKDVFVGLRAGDHLGPYRIQQVIGEGGMGVVYRAMQGEPLEREVAIKVIRPGMASPEVLARFESERRALAMMSHPSIARIYGAGATDDGRPYFAMELVRGAPLNEYCDEKQITHRQRLTLFTEICAAIQHAHQKGIIHRDLKPSNILVSEHEGTPSIKIIDFGVARAVTREHWDKGDGRITLHSQVIGTPLYMSPEQASDSGGHVDTRSDIYSLGAILYELLTGETPFAAETLREAGQAGMREVIRDVEPLKPSERVSRWDDSRSAISERRGVSMQQLSSILRGDLDWIVGKALEKEPDRRYSSAAALADDVKRHLASEPVEAGPASRLYRIRKFLTKHRLAASLASVVLMTLLISTVAIAKFAIAARHAEVLAKQSLEREREARKQADFAKQAAEAAFQQLEIESETNQAIDDFLQNDILRSGSPFEQVNRDIKLRTVLEQAAAKIEQRFSDRPTVEQALHTTVGSVYVDLGDLTAAERHVHRAVELEEAASSGSPAARLDALALQAEWLAKKHRFRRSADVSRECVALATESLGANHPRTLKLTAAGAFVLARYASRRQKSELPAAVKMARTATHTAITNLGKSNETSVFCRHMLALTLQESGQLKEALQELRIALEIQEATAGSRHPRSLSMRFTLANFEFRRQHYVTALAMLESMQGDIPILGETHPTVLYTRRHLAEYRVYKGDWESALEELVDVFEKQLRHWGMNQDAAYTLGLATKLCEKHQRLPQLERILGRAVEWLPDADDQLRIYRRLGRLQYRLGRFEESEKTIRRVCQLQKTVAPERVGDWAMQQGALALTLWKLGRVEEATTLVESCCELAHQGVYTPDQLDQLKAYTRQFYQAMGTPERADELLGAGEPAER